jgi:phospholipid/cholesterol/gamma-HCH transport system substrate-binding protein
LNGAAKRNKMKTTPSQKARIGIFTLVGIGLLVAGIFIIGSKKNMFGNTFNIYGLYRNVGGLQLGNNIRFAGINVGTVEDITIVNDTTVRVDMRLQAKVRPFLKKDAIASIGSDGLMGDRLITIAPGSEGGGLLGKNEQIKTVDPTGFDKIISRFGQVVDNAEIITASLADISEQISSGEGSLGRLIYTDSLERGLRQTIGAAKTGVQGFSDNMTALKSNFLLKGYYKRKAKDSVKAAKQEAKDQRKEERRARRRGETKNEE